MHYLIINGSPHRGNTWKLAEMAQQQIAAANTKTEFRELQLAAIALPFCLGCSNCFRKGSGFCPHRNVMDVIIADMDWADGIIIATSTFNMAPPALFKNLLDHLCYMLHRPYFFTKKALVITTTGGVGAGTAAKNIAGTLSGIGFNRVYCLAVAAHSWNCFRPSEKVIRKTKRITARFFRDTELGKLHPPTLLELIPYNLFRGMCLSNTGEHDYPTIDGDHWTDPQRAHRCYDRAIPVRRVHRLFGAVFYGIGKIGGRRIPISYQKDAQT